MIMSAEVPQLLDVPAQKLVIESVTDFQAYDAFNRKFFDANPPNERWLKFVRKELSNPDYEDLPVEYFRFLGLVGIVFAQFGMSTLETQIFRHKKKDFKKSPIDPRHQLALACYGGSINTQAYPIKKKWAERIAESDPDIAPGVWGIMPKVTSGKITKRFKERQLRYVKADAVTKLLRPKPICIPDQKLNKSLAKLGFTGENAESMTDEQFRDDVLPGAQEAVKGYVNLMPIFERYI